MDLDVTFEEMLDEYLRAIENQEPLIDRSVGTLTHIEGGALMLCAWGIRQRLRWLYRQVWPDSADSANLDRHVSERGLSRLAGETDAQLLVRYFGVLRQPPAGGNRYDWPRWARETAGVSHTTWTEYCRAAWVVENARGAGTINVPLYSDRSEDATQLTAWANNHAYTAGNLVKDSTRTGVLRPYIALTSGTSSGTGVTDDSGVAWEDAEEYPSADLVTAVDNYLDTKRPMGIWDYACYPILKQTQDVTMSLTGSAVSAQSVADQITAFMKTLTGGKTLYRAQLISIAVDAGADNATVSTPATDFAPTWGPTTYRRVWPGRVTVSVT